MKDHPVIDTPYTWNYYQDQGPILINYVARLKGVNTKPPADPFTYLELGCGNGVTANALAASFPKGTFVAVDANPEHIENARRLAGKGSLSNIRFIDKSFGGICDEDLPSFDYITLHGVYSWINAGVRREIRDIIDKFLAPRGLVYVSYDTVPGWAAFLPLREIMFSHTADMKEGTLAKVVEGLKFLKFLRDNDLIYFKNNPLAGKMLDTLMKKDTHYVAHEFFNESWHPQFFSEVNAEMEDIGLHFIGCTELKKNFSDSMVPACFRPRLEDTKDPIGRETLKSFILNESFRRDVYCRDTAPMAEAGNEPLFSDWIFGNFDLAKPPPRDQGNGTQEDEDELDLVREHTDGSRTVAEINLLAALNPLEEDEIIGNIHKLVAAGRLWPLATPMRRTNGVVPDKYDIVHDLNRTLLRDRLLKDSRCFLASEIIGGCIRIELIQGLLLLAGEEFGLTQAPVQALKIIEKSKSPWRREGKEISDPAQRRRVMHEEYQEFRETKVPLLLGAGIIEPSV